MQFYTEFKVLLLTFKAVHNLAPHPPYLSELLHVPSPSGSLRADDLMHFTMMQKGPSN